MSSVSKKSIISEANDFLREEALSKMLPFIKGQIPRVEEEIKESLLGKKDGIKKQYLIDVFEVDGKEEVVMYVLNKDRVEISILTDGDSQEEKSIIDTHTSGEWVEKIISGKVGSNK